MLYGFGRSKTSGSFGTMGSAVLITVLLTMLILAPSSVGQERFWDDISIEEVDSWDDPMGEGEEILFDVSPDGTKLALAGTDEGGKLQVTDRDMAPIAEHWFVEGRAKGVRWSETGTWVAVWGTDPSQIGDFLVVLRGATLEPVPEIDLNVSVSLETIHSVLFLSTDYIVAISGLDWNGTSRVVILETRTGVILQNHQWRDDLAVIDLASDGHYLMCIDEGGGITGIETSSWTGLTYFEGRDALPTANANYPPRTREFLLGYEDGWVKFWGGEFREVEAEWRATSVGPVQGIAWAFEVRGDYYLVVTPEPGGGSSLSGYYSANGSAVNQPVTREPFKTVGDVTALLTDPSANGLIWASFADGSIALYKVATVSDAPPLVTVIDPDPEKEYAKPFLAHGTVVDDHDRIEYVRVQLDGDEWEDANVSGNEWSIWIGGNFDGGQRRIEIEAFDGRNHTRVKVFYDVPMKDDSEGIDPWIWAVFFSILIPVILIVMLIRMRKKRNQGTGKD